MFLGRPSTTVGGLYILHGDDAFLKRQALLTIRARALGEDVDESAVSTYAGDKAAYAEVIDDLDTVPFFTAKRLILVENADPFVTKHRGQLEEKVHHLPPHGILVLDVKTWASNTRLAKMVDDASTIACKAPPPFKAASWCSEWCQKRYHKQIVPAAAQLLVDLIGAELGLLDQELNKLSIYIGDRKNIELADVDKLVANQRAENIWLIFDAIGQGQVKRALAILDSLFEAGEEPFRLLGAMGSQLRKLAQATRFSAMQGGTLVTALEHAGVPPFALKSAEQQLRHLGRKRAERLLDDLLELNMSLRGESPLPQRTLFERFILRLARKDAVRRP